MTIRDCVTINAPPAEVWKYVENPEYMKRWNPKVQWVSAHDGPRASGYVYGITYVMNGRAKEFRGEYVTYEVPRVLTIRLTSPAMPRESLVEERYTLADLGKATLLEQRVVVADPGMNIVWRLLAEFILRFGRPVGERYLETLKELVEHGA